MRNLVIKISKNDHNVQQFIHNIYIVHNWSSMKFIRINLFLVDKISKNPTSTITIQVDFSFLFALPWSWWSWAWSYLAVVTRAANPDYKCGLLHTWSSFLTAFISSRGDIIVALWAEAYEAESILLTLTGTTFFGQIHV